MATTASNASQTHGDSAVRFESPEAHIERLRTRISELTAELAHLRTSAASPYFTRAEAADHYRCSVVKIDRILASGAVRRLKFGRDTLIRRTELEAFVEQ